MKSLSEERAVILAEYIIENESTVRAAAKVFGVSKSTVHKDITKKLKEISPSLYIHCRKVLERNKSERHIRGGNATKERFAQKQKI